MSLISVGSISLDSTLTGVQQAKEASRLGLGMKVRTPYANSWVYHMLVQVERMEGRAKVIVSYIICFGWCVSGVREVYIPWEGGKEGGRGSNQDAGGGSP